MSVVSVQPKSFILALFIRDDNERFLLGDNGYDFKESQLHFSANSIENDEVQKQGTDGVMLAGQVRRASVQSFDGFVGDATMAKETIEQMRRDFIAFFLKGHHYRVIYVDCNRNAWQRKGGYLVDAPEVKELWQVHPEYHVGLNFEDVNYYSYDEDAGGNEILANLVDVPVSTAVSGGLVWDEDGAVSEDAGDISYDEETADATPAKNVYITDATEAPLASFQLDGETSQNGTPTPSAPVAVNTTTGENVVKITGKNLFNETDTPWIATTHYNTTTGAIEAWANYYGIREYQPVSASTQYIVSSAVSGNLQVVFYDGSKTFLSATSGSASFTTPANCQYVRWSRYTETAPTNTQLELGSTATAYEPYQGQSYTISLGSIELCKIGDYQDYIYKSDDKWYVHEAVGKWTVNPNDGWYASGSHVIKCLYANSSIINPVHFNTSAKCSDMPYVVETALYQGTTSVGFAIAGDGLYFSNNDWTVDQMKTWATNSHPVIYYALDTSSDTEITNAALVAQLDALLTTARTYTGINNIFTITPNEQGTLEISYYTKYQPMVGSGGYVWEAGGAGGPTIIMNDSIDYVSPVWTIYGPTTNPQLENATTGETIEYVGTIAEGQTLTIDMGEQTASLDGLNVISNLVGDFVQLAPGRNNIIYSVSGDAGASELGWSEIVG